MTPPSLPLRTIVSPDDDPWGRSERQQAHDMGLCLDCGPGHTYTAACWWSRRWRQKDATW